MKMKVSLGPVEKQVGLLVGVVEPLGGEVYLVGGAVRDAILGREVKDYDLLVRGVAGNLVRTLLVSFGIVNAVGKSFGVFKLRLPDGPELDVALPRTERSNGPGHRDFEVRSDERLSVEEDLVRRDFTVNSVAVRLSAGESGGLVVDPLAGVADLKGRILRVNSLKSFEDDPLRLLRGCQFAGRFGLVAEPKTLFMMRESANLLRTVASERVFLELEKLLYKSDRPSAGFALMDDTGILALILPEVANMKGRSRKLPNGQEANVLRHALASVDALAGRRPALAWAALLRDAGSTPAESETAARAVLVRLKADNALLNEVRTLVREQRLFVDRASRSMPEMRRLIGRFGVETCGMLLDLAEADGADGGRVSAMRSMLDEQSEMPCRVDQLAIGGKEVMEALGIPAGPEVKRALQFLLDGVLEKPQTNDRDVLMGHLAAYRNSLGEVRR